MLNLALSRSLLLTAITERQSMDIGVSLMYWPWFEVDEQLELSKLADSLGFHSLWFAESYGQDATAMLGWGLESCKSRRANPPRPPPPQRLSTESRVAE